MNFEITHSSGAIRSIERAPASDPFFPLPPAAPQARAGSEPRPVAAQHEQNVVVAVGEVNRAMEPFEVSLQFTHDRETDTLVVKMVNNRTGEVLHQMPSEVTLHLSAVIGKLQGVIYDRTV